jgi:DNA-binding transcriptional ArsR family regulator
MEEKIVISSLAALAHPIRLQVFRALVVVGSDGLTPGSVATALELAPATLSFHLKELLHAGLVDQERDGRNLIYRANYTNMNEVLTYLTANCCQGQTDCLATEAACCDPARMTTHKE